MILFNEEILDEVRHLEDEIAMIFCGDDLLYEKAGFDSANYQRLEYIEGTGTQWIDTGICAAENQDIEIDFQITGTRNFTYGFWGSVTAKAYFEYEYNNARFVVRYVQENTTKYISFSNTGRGKIKYSIDGNSRDVVIGGSSSSGTVSFVDSERSYYLFAYNGNLGTPSTNKGRYRLYSYIVTENGKIVQELVPCYRKSDGETGLYDTISGRFLMNQGTGSFRRGSELAA